MIENVMRTEIGLKMRTGICMLLIHNREILLSFIYFYRRTKTKFLTSTSSIRIIGKRMVTNAATRYAFFSV